MSATARATDTDRSRSRDQGRILLVTDDPTSAAYGTALEHGGFAVVGVASGLAALVALRRTRPHVVVMDAKLKGVSAEELARMLMQTQEAVPFVFVGDGESSTVRRGAALAAGGFDYFQIPSDIALLVARMGQLVTLKQTMDQLRAEADLDYLTGLANRRRFRTALGHELERWRRYKVLCALILLDVDHLKRVNDTHGHSAGDIVIRRIASALTEHSRDNDTAARLGGEEFALLLAGVDEKKAVAAAERLRQAVSAEPIEHIGTVTISLGVAACPAHGNTERSLYAASDAALYCAKSAGRDCTVIATPIETAPKVIH